MVNNTISREQFLARIALAKKVPSLAHLPAFGLMAPRDWDYTNSNLMSHAQDILKREGIEGVVYQVAPALFWYRINNDIECHDWDRKKNDET